MTKTLLFTVLLLVTHSCIAEVLILANGTQLKGRIGELSDDIVKFHTDTYRTISLLTIADAIPDKGIDQETLKKQTLAISRLKLGINTEKHLLSTFSRKVQGLLLNEKFVDLDELANNLRTNNVRNDYGTWMLARFYIAIKSDLNKRDKLAYEQRLQLIRRWIETTDSITSKISELAVNRDLGWAYRGNGYSDTVSNDAMHKFSQHFEASLLKARRVQAISHEDAMLYVYLITLYRGLSYDKSEILKLVSEVEQYHAGFLSLYEVTIDALHPKWGGSFVMVKKFIEDSSAQPLNASSPELYFHLVRYASNQIKDIDELLSIVDWTRLERSYRHYAKRYPINDSHLLLMAKISCALNLNVQCSEYFSRSSQQWNHFAKRIWGSKTQMEAYLRWKDQNTIALERLTKALALPKSTIELDANLERFLKSGGDINFRNIRGKTLLNISVENNDIQMLEALIKIGADIHLKNKKGETNLHLSAKTNSPRVLLALLKHKAKIDSTTTLYTEMPIHYAAKRGYNHHVLALVEHKPSHINSVTNQGYSALHLATTNGHQSTVLALIDAGANVDQLTSSNDSALHLAIRNRQVNIARSLIDSGVKLNGRNAHNQTPLSIAKEEGIQELIRVLESNNAHDSEAHISKITLHQAGELMDEAHKYITPEHYKKAKSLIQEVLKLNPQSAFAYHDLSFINMYYERDYLESAKNIEKTLELNPNRIEAYYQAGRTYHMLKRPDKYVEFFNRYINYAPDTYNTRDLLDKYQHLLSHHSTAKKRTEKQSEIVASNTALVRSAIAVLSILILLFVWVRYKQAHNR